MTDTILLERKAAIAVVTLNRPEALNAFDQPMATALHQAMATIAADTTIRAVLLQAHGKYFSAGGDVRWFHELAQAEPEFRQQAFTTLIETVHAIIEIISTLHAPVVAAVQGGASGFGIGLMAACDFVLTSPASKFSMAYMDLGAPSDGGATWILPRLMGMRRARELILLSERFDGERALALDLVNRLVAPDMLTAESMQLVAQLAAGPTLAYGHVKRLLAQSFHTSLTDQLRAEQHAFLLNTEAEDFSEGLSAFMQKRASLFSGT